MGKRVKTLVLGLSVIGTVILGAGLELLRFGGAFRSVPAEFAGSCRAIDLDLGKDENGELILASSEDIQIDRFSGAAYLSVLDRVSFGTKKPTIGTIKWIDLNVADPKPISALRDALPGFHPHGISLWNQAGQPMRLFAISHVSEKEEAVEIFEKEGDKFVARSSVRDAENFKHLNAIAAAGPNQFYAVNDHPRQSDGRTLADALLRRSTGSLVFHDGKLGKPVPISLRYPVGLALSPKLDRLYIAEAGRKALRIYTRDPVTGALDLAHPQVVDLGTAPDNLNVDEDGVVWMAAHPKLLSFGSHMKNPRRRAPTQVLRFAPDGPEPRLRTVYQNDGAQISAGSVAARWRDEFLIGAVLDPKVLICKPAP